MATTLSVYKALADQSNFIPNDKLVSILASCSIGAITGARSKLTTLGYEFEQFKTADNGVDVTGWQVVKRPQDDITLLKDELVLLEMRIAEIRVKLGE